MYVLPGRCGALEEPRLENMNGNGGIKIDEIVVGPLATNCYIVSCTETLEAIIIDPGGDADRISKIIEEISVTPVKIVLTHGHSDHMAGAPDLIRKYGIGIALHGEDIPTMKRSVEEAPFWGLGHVECPDVETLLAGGDTVDFGMASGKVLHTPGHTRGGISILFDGDGLVFAGDTLFARSIGRTDFFGGDLETLLRSVREKLFTLPDDTAVYCGHGPMTYIGEEKRSNPFLKGQF